MAKYTYKLEFTPAAGVLFIPDADAIYTWTKERSNAAFLRKGVQEFTITRDYDNEGSFINATVFNTLWEWYFDTSKQTTEILLKIYKDGVLDFDGVFYILDGDIDINDGFYTVKVEPDDFYRTFLAYADNDIDIIDGEGAYTAWYQYNTEEEEFDNESDTPPTNANEGSPLPDGYWFKRDSHFPFIWVRQKSQYDIDDTYGVVPDNIKYNGFWYYKAQYGGKNYYFPNCFLLTDTIQLILDTMLSGTALDGMQLVSHFFNDADDYVTARGANYLMNTMIEQRSDTKDPDASDKATLGRISFNTLIDELTAMLNIKWYIDGSDLRIEHEKYFYNGLSTSGNKTVGIDLTDQSKYAAPEILNHYILDTLKFEKPNDQKIKLETIDFVDVVMLDFRDDLNYIEYDTVRFNEAKRAHVVNNISTDIHKAINDSNAISDDGFYLFNIRVIDSGQGLIITKPFYFNHTDGNDYQIGNGGFSVKWLLYDYYTYGRQDKSGTQIYSGTVHPGELYSVLGSLPVYLQKDIVFLLNDSDTININQYIATYLIKSDEIKYKVDGSIIAISHDLNTDFVTVTLGFEL